MADIGSIEDALVERLAVILDPTDYAGPNVYQPETVFQTDAKVYATVNGQDRMVNCMARLFRGFPVPDDLDVDLRSGVSNVSVFSVSGMSRLLQGYLDSPYCAYEVPVTLTAEVNGDRVTFGGTGGSGQITGIAIGDGAVRRAYAMRLTDLDTPETVAETFGAIIPFASVNGSIVTIPNSRLLRVAVGGDVTVNTDIQLQSQMFDIHIWTMNPQTRDALSALITLGMAKTKIIPFADGSSSRMVLYRGSWTDDATQDTEVWHRYMRYEVEYSTVDQIVVPPILFIGIKLNDVRLFGEFDWRTFQSPGHILNRTSGQIFMSDGTILSHRVGEIDWRTYQTPGHILNRTGGQIFMNDAAILAHRSG